MATRKSKVVIVEEPTETCKSCRCGWFVESHDESVWFCRFMPPAVTYDFAEQTQISTLPVVSADHWCAQFKPKLND